MSTKKAKKTAFPVAEGVRGNERNSKTTARKRPLWSGVRGVVAALSMTIGCLSSSNDDHSLPTTTDIDASTGDATTSTERDASLPGEDAATTNDASTSDAGPRSSPRLPMFSAYFAATNAHGDVISEMSGAFGAGHVDPSFLPSAKAAHVRPIVNLQYYLFDFPTPVTEKPKTFAPNARATLRADIDKKLSDLSAAIAPYEDEIQAFYITDEPYSPPWLVPRAVLEAAIAKVKKVFPTIPTMLVIAHHCFDPSVPPESADCSSTFPGSERGVPANLDWAMFDWYTNDDAPNTMLQTFTHRTIEGVARMKKVTTKPIVLVGESYSKNRTEPELVELAHRYYGLMMAEPQIQGIDWFLWADVKPSFDGLHSMPMARAAVRVLGRDLMHQHNEDPDAIIPVTEWYKSSAPDYDYRAWYSRGWEKGDYVPTRAAFGLLPIGTAKTSPFYRCRLDRGSSVDSYLTTDASCGVDAGSLAAPTETLGAISSISQGAATKQLHRWVLATAPYDHVYSTDASRSLPGYTYQFPVGYVVPPEKL